MVTISHHLHIHLKVAEDWIKQYANEVKVSSVRAREKAIQHAIERFNTKPIQTIKKHDYQRFVDDMNAQYSKIMLIVLSHLQI